MKSDMLIQLSSGRTYLGEGAITVLGSEAACLGTRALILTDENFWYKIEAEVRESLEQAHIVYEIMFHTGHCCPAAYEKARVRAVDVKADVLIGIGGGRLLDTTKIASDMAGIRSITVPTSAATCAATAWLSVEYTSEGAFVGNYWTKYPPFCTITDTDIIIKKCPIRYNLAGIVDAMAKYPEIEYNFKFTDNFERNAFSETAAETARQNYRYFLEQGQNLIMKFNKGIIDVQIEDAVARSIAVTGLVSCLACGGKQAAVSHLLYSYICCFHPAVAERYLHGEIVGASLCYQLTINGCEACEVEALRHYLHYMGMPTCLGELGINLTPEENEKILDFLKPRLNISDAELFRIEQEMPLV